MSKTTPFFSLSDSKVLFLYPPKHLRIFVLQNLIYCITFLLYCSSFSKSLFLCSSSDDLLCLYLSVWHLEAQWLKKKAEKEATFPQDRHKPGWYWSHSALWDGLSPELLFKCWKLCALAGAVGFAFSRVKKTLNNPMACLLNIEVQGNQ